MRMWVWMLMMVMMVRLLIRLLVGLIGWTDIGVNVYDRNRLRWRRGLRLRLRLGLRLCLRLHRWLTWELRRLRSCGELQLNSGSNRPQKGVKDVADIARISHGTHDHSSEVVELVHQNSRIESWLWRLRRLRHLPSRLSLCWTILPHRLASFGTSHQMNGLVIALN